MWRDRTVVQTIGARVPTQSVQDAQRKVFFCGVSFAKWPERSSEMVVFAYFLECKPSAICLSETIFRGSTEHLHAIVEPRFSFLAVAEVEIIVVQADAELLSQMTRDACAKVIPV